MRVPQKLRPGTLTANARGLASLPGRGLQAFLGRPIPGVATILATSRRWTNTVPSISTDGTVPAFTIR